MYSEEAAFTERLVRRNGASECFTSNDDVFNNTVRIAVNDGKIGRICLPDIATTFPTDSRWVRPNLPLIACSCILVIALRHPPRAGFCGRTPFVL